MTIKPTLDRRDIKHQLSEYTTFELVSVLAHAENSRRQMDHFVESVTAELTRRGNAHEQILVSLNLARRIGAGRSSRFSRRREQPKRALASARNIWIG
jgi:hypothetical protein